MNENESKACPLEVTAMDAPETRGDVAKAIATIEDSKATHVDWGRWFAANPDEEAKHSKTVHSAKEQFKIVAAYENVLNCLRSIPLFTSEITQLKQQLEEANRLAAYKDETATTFMNQVKRLQSELAAKTEELERVRKAFNCASLTASNARGMAWHVGQGEPFAGLNPDALKLWLETIASQLEAFAATLTTEHSSAVPTCKDGLQVGELNLEKKEN